MRPDRKVTLAIILTLAAMYLFTILLPYLLEDNVGNFQYGTILFLLIIGFLALVLMVRKITKRRYGLRWTLPSADPC